MNIKTPCSIMINNGVQAIGIGDGLYNIELIDQNQKQYSLSINLLDKLTEMVDQELSNRKHFSKIFYLAFKDTEESFFNHPDHVIINYLDANEIIPPNTSDKKEIFKFNVKKLLAAYNRWKGTSLKYKDVEKLCW